jgi:hypothetical protein
MEAVKTRNENKTKTIKLIVSSGQYETSACVVTVKYHTLRGLARRIRQLSDEYAVYGDNWAGWLKANVAIKSPKDRWGDNSIIGGRWCEPANGWLDLDNLEEELKFYVK